ncbi:putative Transmembrane protein [Quillaja saponaria]|uniref:Transmembrane protein n=1 Tax=Quillaja saponaria TaxID=32244 RepID=A0AAD7P6W7_QUISA|nr:putative Transmembrane protein [Quillaja saponaria]
MKASLLKTQNFFVLFLLLNSVFFVSEARPLNNVIDSSKFVRGGAVDLFDWLSLGAIKQSGPSPGKGHKFTNYQTLGGIKDSGPSPGAGHKFTNYQTLGGIKDSGPSSGGKGH